MNDDPDRTTDEPSVPLLKRAEVRPFGSRLDRVDMSGLSHTGLVRSTNEDVFLTMQAERALRIVQSNLPPDTLHDIETENCHGMLVADGVGGMAGGQVASRLAATSVIHQVLDTPDWILLSGGEEGQRLLRRMTRRFEQVDAVLRSASAERSDLAGMGTTLTAVVNLGRELFVAHVGDSRAYLCRGTKFEQVTHDHTGAQELADAGPIRRQDITKHPHRHALTRALGGPLKVSNPDVARLPLEDGDQIMICSDGRTDLVDDEAIAATLRAAPTASEACQTLVEMALNRGGRDNITVAVARCCFPPTASDR